MLTTLKGNVAACSALLGYITAGTTMLELLTNPTVGALGDARGRRPVLLAAALGNAVMKLGVALTGSLRSTVLEAVLSGSMCAVSSTVISAAVADCSHTEQQISTRMALNGVAGAVGFIIGPIVGGIINGKYGARAAYACASAVAALQALYIYKALPETSGMQPKHTPQPEAAAAAAATENSCSGSGADKSSVPVLVNPFTSAMKLFTGSKQLRCLSMTGAVQCALEPRAWSNVMLLYMRTHVGLSAGTFGKFAASFAVSSVFAKLWVKQSLGILGPATSFIP